MDNKSGPIYEETMGMLSSIFRHDHRGDPRSDHRGQRKILSVLFENGPLSVSELSQRLGIMTGSTSEMVNKLETKGLVAKMQNSVDKRKVDISITSDGRKRIEMHRSEHHTKANNPLECLSLDEINTLQRILQKVIDAQNRA